MFFLYVGSLERMPERLTVLLTDLHFTWNEENVSQHTKKGGIYQRREREIPTNVNNQHRRSAFNMMGFFNGDGCDHTQPTVMFYGPHKNHKTFFSIFFFHLFLPRLIKWHIQQFYLRYFYFGADRNSFISGYVANGYFRINSFFIRYNWMRFYWKVCRITRIWWNRMHTHTHTQTAIQLSNCKNEPPNDLRSEK